MDLPSPLTTAYLSTLPLLLSPHPSLSASAALALAKLRPLASTAPASAHNSSNALASTSKAVLTDSNATQCGFCGATLVAGLTGTVALAGKEWVGRCGGCGGETRRAVVGGEGEEGVRGRGKGRFGRVKRRVVRARVEAAKAKAKGAKGDGGRETLGEAIPMRPVAQPTKLPVFQPKPANTPPTITTSLSSSARPSPAPSSARAPPSAASSPAPPARPSPSPSSAPSSARASPAPKAAQSTAPGSLDAPGKKRKRSNKPAGLAELLAAKKQAAAGGAGSGKLGLQDFLSGI